MIVYSFAWRRAGDSPCNVRLAQAATRIIRDESEPILVLAQRTTAKILKELGVSCVAADRQAGYEGSEEPTRQATNLFRRLGIIEVIPVAQPCLQLTKCIQLCRAAGFCTPSFMELARMIGWIGFDRQSVQPATRDPFRLAFYTARQILFGYRPPIEQSEP